MFADGLLFLAASSNSRFLKANHHRRQFDLLRRTGIVLAIFILPLVVCHLLEKAPVWHHRRLYFVAIGSMQENNPRCVDLEQERRQ